MTPLGQGLRKSEVILDDQDRDDILDALTIYINNLATVASFGSTQFLGAQIRLTNLKSYLTRVLLEENNEH